MVAKIVTFATETVAKKATIATETVTEMATIIGLDNTYHRYRKDL
ncbi:MAG: hypothetical protein ACE14V_01630 [bacterium]